MSLNGSDEKIIMFLDLSVDRAEITAGVCDALARMKLYRENQNLMEQIDVSEVLLRDLEDLVNTEHDRALEKFEDESNANLLKQLKKLSDSGQDAYWTNGNLALAFDPDLLPWRE